MFYTDASQFTHTARFYGIPVYLNLEDADMPTVAGTNIIFDKLLDIAMFVHNTAIEFVIQLFAYLFNYPYEAGFPFRITGKLQK